MAIYFWEVIDHKSITEKPIIKNFWGKKTANQTAHDSGWNAVSLHILDTDNEKICVKSIMAIVKGDGEKEIKFRIISTTSILQHSILCFSSFNVACNSRWVEDTGSFLSYSPTTPWLGFKGALKCLNFKYQAMVGKRKEHQQPMLWITYSRIVVLST